MFGDDIQEVPEYSMYHGGIGKARMQRGPAADLRIVTDEPKRAADCPHFLVARTSPIHCSKRMGLRPLSVESSIIRHAQKSTQGLCVHGYWHKREVRERLSLIHGLGERI